MSRVMHHAAWIATGLLCAIVAPVPAGADEYEADLALQLANPVAALISVPLQLNYNSDIGRG